MLKPHAGWRWVRTLMAICLTMSCGFFLLRPTTNVMGQGTSKSKKPSTATPSKSELGDDLSNAIELIEKNDFATFIELYGPVEMLRKLRQQDLVSRASTIMASQPRMKPQLLTLLKALKEQSPKFDKSGGMATIEFNESMGNVEEVPGELNIPETFNVKVIGLGSDLARVIADATKLLEAGDMSAFVDNLLPASELARIQAPDARQALLQHFKDTPELAQSMIVDFKLLQTMKSEISKDGNVATFKISAGDSQPPRMVKFQKVDAHWRLFDDSPRVVTELSRQVKLKPGSTMKVIQMERIGGNWRFIELPMLRLDGQ